MIRLDSLALALCLGFVLTAGVAVAEGPVAWWTFDSAGEGLVTDRAANRDDRVDGNHKIIQGAVIIYESGNRMHYVKDRDIRGYERPGACNHWPVGQARCDGRTVQAADRPTHFLGFPISSPPVHENEDRTWWNGIYGMTDLPMEKLVSLARSWNYPPRLEASDGFQDRGYDRGQRAFVLERSGRPSNNLQIAVAASKDSPVYNPALVIRGWGTSDATLAIDGEGIPQGPTFRVGHRHNLGSSDLIVWIEHEAAEPFAMTLKAAK